MPAPKVNPFTTLAKNLRAIRAYRNLQAKEVAAKANIHVNTLYFWEQGRFQPNSRSLEKLASAYGVSVASFFNQRGPTYDT